MVARASAAYARCSAARRPLRPWRAATASCSADAGECFGRVLFELAKFVEGLRLLVELAVRVSAEVDDLRVPGARVGLGVGRPIVELLLEGERLVEVFLRVGERRLELGGGLVAELRARELELLLARLDGVVGRDESGCRAPPSSPSTRPRVGPGPPESVTAPPERRRRRLSCASARR
jgi:hypothetical protein